MAYLVFLSTAVNFGLHGFLTKVMNFIIVAVSVVFWGGDGFCKSGPASRDRC